MTDLTAQDPWVQRIGAWFGERFPPAMLVFGLPTFLAANLLGQVTATSSGRDGTPMVRLGAASVAGWLAAVGFLLCVRIFDEHKDYDDDVRLHPERLLSRGVVRLRELDVIQAVVAVGLALYCTWLDRGFGPVWFTFGLAAGWLLLMRVEFFVGSWLRPRIVAYAVSHAVVTPLAAWWMFTTGSGRLAADGVLLPFLAASYLSSLLFELTRKLAAPEDERPGVLTYSSVLGPSRAARLTGWLVLGHAVAMVVVLATAPGLDVGASMWLWGHAIGIVAVSAMLALGVYARRPDADSHKPLEALVGLNLLVPSLAVIVSAVVASPVEWGLR